jgi:hypothetical protein
MKKFRSIVHSQLILQTQIIKSLKLLFFILGTAAFFIPQTLYAEIKIAIVDTGFCPNQLKQKMRIESVIDLTKSVVLDCSKVDPKNPRMHGQLVLEEFLQYLDLEKHSVYLYPLIVFDKDGQQKKDYWTSALALIKKNKIDFVLSASGLITNEKIQKELPGIWFVPSGRLAPGIKEDTSLFPQNLAPLENLFLIGDFYDGREIIYDQALLYKDKIDYYFSSGIKGFQGTSRAVAHAAARALNLCPLANMRECLKKGRQEKKDQVIQKVFYSY